MTCSDYEDLAVLALHGEAPAEGERAWRDHRAACAACRETHAERSRLVSIGRAAFAAPLPEAAVRRVVALAARRRAPVRRAVSTMAAAGLAAWMSLAALPFRGSDAAPPVEPPIELEGEDEIDVRVEALGRDVVSLREGLEGVAEFDRRTGEISEGLERLRAATETDEF